MLVQFKSRVGGFVSFGDVALRLIRMTGHSGTVPGAIPAEGIADALARLEAALESVEEETPAEDPPEAGERPVGLRQRAFPLVELLRAAEREDCPVMWEKG